MSRRTSWYYKARRDIDGHLSVTQHGIWTWGLYVSIEGICGDTVAQESPQWI